MHGCSALAFVLWGFQFRREWSRNPLPASRFQQLEPRGLSTSIPVDWSLPKSNATSWASLAVPAKLTHLLWVGHPAANLRIDSTRSSVICQNGRHKKTGNTTATTQRHSQRQRTERERRREGEGEGEGEGQRERERKRKTPPTYMSKKAHFFTHDCLGIHWLKRELRTLSKWTNICLP